MEKIKLNEIKQLLKKGFNAEMLASAFNTSVSHINELKRKPVENEIYHEKDINADALLEFAIKRNIDIDSIDFELIVNSKAIRNKAVEIALHTDTPFGEIIEIINVGSKTIYKCCNHSNNDFISYVFLNDIKDAMKK